jgi:aldose 1-epimerase
MERIDLAAGRMTIGVAPALGGSLVDARWRDGGRDVLLTRPAKVPLASATASHMTSFVMAPFANRIADGRFPFAGGEIRLPINRPAQRVAIHGIARNRPWDVTARSADALTVRLEFAEADYPYRFVATQRYAVRDDGFAITLEVVNAGDAPLPFGIGHHPYFRRAPDTAVSFTARGWFDVDPHRNLPVAAHGAPDGPALPVTLLASGSDGLDRHYFGWSRAATVRWPDIGLALEVTADAGLPNAHLYFSPEEASVCVEPVSHVPDVVNHPEWRACGDMRVLAPGASLAGTLDCRVTGLAA